MAEGKTSSIKGPIITTELVDKATDMGLNNFEYNFYSDKGMGKESKSLFFDSIADVPITSAGAFDSNRAVGSRNTRWITFNIPAIDALSRANPFVKKSVNYLSSKPLINGIDINSPRNQLKSEDEIVVLETLKDLYVSLKSVLSKGYTYGGAAGLLCFENQFSPEDLKKPLIISKIKKGSFLGIKPLARWFQVEPALDKELIKEVGGDTGINDARMIGMPMYYNVNLSGGMVGNSDRADFVVHISRLLTYNAELPSYIETQIERFWGPSIVELAWNELSKDSRLWNAITKSAEKNNMGIFKIKGLGLGTQVNATSKARIETKLSYIKFGSTNNIIPIDANDDFDFADASLSGFNDILNSSNSRLAGAFKVPVSVLFPNVAGDDEDKSYIQSLTELNDTQMRVLRVWYNRLLPVIIKSKIGKTVKDVMYSFNPIETQTLKERAEMAKTNSDTVLNLYNIGAIDKASAIKIVDTIAKDPKYMSQNIHIKYKKEILAMAEKGEFETANSDKIEVARELNQMQEDSKGTAGVNNPASNNSGGGNPKVTKKPLKKNVLNPDKGKK